MEVSETKGQASMRMHPPFHQYTNIRSIIIRLRGGDDQCRRGVRRRCTSTGDGCGRDSYRWCANTSCGMKGTPSWLTSLVFEMFYDPNTDVANVSCLSSLLLWIHINMMCVSVITDAYTQYILWNRKEVCTTASYRCTWSCPSSRFLRMRSSVLFKHISYYVKNCPRHTWQHGNWHAE